MFLYSIQLRLSVVSLSQLSQKDIDSLRRRALYHLALRVANKL